MVNQSAAFGILQRPEQYVVDFDWLPSTNRTSFNESLPLILMGVEGCGVGGRMVASQICTSFSITAHKRRSSESEEGSSSWRVLMDGRDDDAL
jgi:hypothetical protein